MPTKSQEAAAELAALFRARSPLIWLLTKEEARVESYVIEAAASAGYSACTWDVAQGATLAGTLTPAPIGSRDPGDMLQAIGDAARGTGTATRTVWIMRDLPTWLAGPPGATPLRTLRNLARSLPGTPRDRAQAIVVISPDGQVPPELSAHATVIEWPLPDKQEIGTLLDGAIASLPDELAATAAPNGTRDKAIDAALGLSGEEAQATFAKSLVQHRRIDPATIAKEKKRVITREKILEWYDPLPGGLEAVGGLDILKSWVIGRGLAYSTAARAYGLPAPRGILLVGVPGCGKSMVAKAVATAYQIPLLRVDLNALKGKFVGQSEGNLRRMIQVIEVIGRCVIWIDEIEKAIQGATSGSADGGVSSDALGTILSWMQERSGESFIIATANDAESLPPELMRKGRFDEVFSVDLPNRKERGEILKASLKTYKRDAVNLDYGDIISATEGFTGSEITALIPDALFSAYADNAREITTDDLMNVAKRVVPLSKTASEKIARLRKWAQTRARPATTPETESTKDRRELDI